MTCEHRRECILYVCSFNVCEHPGARMCVCVCLCVTLLALGWCVTTVQYHLLTRDLSAVRQPGCAQ